MSQENNQLKPIFKDIFLRTLAFNHKSILEIKPRPGQGKYKAEPKFGTHLFMMAHTNTLSITHTDRERERERERAALQERETLQRLP